MSPSPGGIIYAADVQEAQDASETRPRVKLIQQSAQTLSSATDTAMTWGAGSTDADTHGLHSESVNTSRVTFDRDGTWQARCSLMMSGPGSGLTFTILQVSLYKNGSVVIPRARWSGPTATNVLSSIQATFEVEADAGDYVEMIAQQTCSTAGSKNTAVGSSFTSTFEVIYQRARS